MPLQFLHRLTWVDIALAVAAGLVLRGMWRAYRRRVDRRKELHHLATDAAAAAGVKYAHEHLRELRAAIYADGTAEVAASYRKGQRAAEKAAYNAALADPIEARATARWEDSAVKIREAKANHAESEK